MGGKFDSTNIIEDTAVSVLTPIAHDHEHFLGTDITQIAVQKPVLCAKKNLLSGHSKALEARQGLMSEAEKLGSDIFEEGSDFSAYPSDDGSFDFIWQGGKIKMPAPALQGTHQVQNASLALAAMK